MGMGMGMGREEGREGRCDCECECESRSPGIDPRANGRLSTTKYLTKDEHQPAAIRDAPRALALAAAAAGVSST